MKTAIDHVEETGTVEFPEWLQCPYCGDEGTFRSLENQGHSCCREFLDELDDGG